MFWIPVRALVRKYDCFVYGLDNNHKALATAKELAKSFKIPQSKLYFTDKIIRRMIDNFDIVISQNAFEHFKDPLNALIQMRNLVNKSGKLLITFGPPWYAPYGSHMHFFCKFPWINVFFSERTVMKVRGKYRSDGASRYEDVESGLNKMTIAYFEKILKLSNLKTEFKNYKCVKGLNFFSKIPFFREFFINRASVVLSVA